MALRLQHSFHFQGFVSHIDLKAFVTYMASLVVLLYQKVFDIPAARL